MNKSFLRYTKSSLLKLFKEKDENDFTRNSPNFSIKLHLPCKELCRKVLCVFRESSRCGRATEENMRPKKNLLLTFMNGKNKFSFRVFPSLLFQVRKSKESCGLVDLPANTHSNLKRFSTFNSFLSANEISTQKSSHLRLTLHPCTRSHFNKFELYVFFSCLFRVLFSLDHKK